VDESVVFVGQKPLKYCFFHETNIWGCRSHRFCENVLEVQKCYIRTFSNHVKLGGAQTQHIAGKRKTDCFVCTSRFWIVSLWTWLPHEGV